MIAKVTIVRAVVARRHRAVLGLAEMDVADVDEMPVLVVAGIVARLADILVGDVALLPGRQLRLDRRRVGARPQP